MPFKNENPNEKIYVEDVPISILNKKQKTVNIIHNTVIYLIKKRYINYVFMLISNLEGNYEPILLIDRLVLTIVPLF